VLFDISASEKVTLDRKEGLGYGYEKKIFTVILENGDQIEATTYYATQIDSSLKLYQRYKEHVLLGAEENKLPIDYIS
jgi:gamma-glutamylcyclotransferase